MRIDPTVQRRPCTTRAIAVLETGTDLSVGLSDEIERATATIIRVDPSSVDAALDRFQPFPWAVVGVGAVVPPRLAHQLDSHPILTFWLGDPPAALPQHTREARRWLELVAMVREALTASVAGMRLAPCRGVYLPDHTIASCCDLEGFVAGHQYTWMLRNGAHRQANRVLRQHGVPARIVRHAGGIRLIEAIA
jgi:hypothetical protein